MRIDIVEVIIWNFWELFIRLVLYTYTHRYHTTVYLYMFAYRHVLESSSMHACVHPSIHVLCPLFLFFSPELNLPFLFSPFHPHSLTVFPLLTSHHLTSPFPISLLPPRYSLRPKQMINPLLLPTSPRRAPDQRILAPIVLRERDDIPHGGHVA